MKSLLAFLFCLMAIPALAQTRPVTIVVPVGPGGGTDLLARELAKKLAEVWGQSVVVENKSGAAGSITISGSSSGLTVDPVTVTAR